MPDFRRPDHLPNLRAEGAPPPQDWLPRQRRGITPQMIGRYPDYDVLEDAPHWDDATRRVVLGRLEPARRLRFFRAGEEATARAFLDLLLAQDREPRIPVLEMVDARLAAGKLDGYQYADMPDDRRAWQLVLRGLDEAAQAGGADSFATADPAVRTEVVETLAQGHLEVESLRQLNQQRALALCLRMAAAAFYSHPWAWNEIGFGGPAYPRGYMRIGASGVREPRERAAATEPDPTQLERSR